VFSVSKQFAWFCKGKGSLNIVLKAAYVTSLALCVTDKAGVQARPQPRPALTDFGLQPDSLT